MTKRKIIIDTDPGHDDALAIMLLEKSEQFDIKAITTVAGNSTVENTTNNTRYILDLLNSDTPLYSGSANPLKKELILAEVHGESGLAGATITKKVSPDDQAVDRIIEIVKDNPGKITILTLGPLTNIARAFIKAPEIIPLLDSIVMMGGAIAVPGNKNRVAEFNFFVDPEAVNIVFKAEINKTIVPLDACNHVFLSLEDFDNLKEADFYKEIKSMMEHYIEGIHKFEKTEGALMYDPLAAYYLMNPKAFIQQMMDVQIETDSELTRGMTVADRRNWGEKSENVNVAIYADRDMFVTDFINTLKK